MRYLLYAIILSFGFLWLACAEDNPPTARPRLYPYVHIPKPAYQTFDTNFCQFRCEISNFASIEQDTVFFNERPPNACWFNIYYKEYNSRIHCTYSDIRNKKEFQSLASDAYELAQKQNIKASFIDDFTIHTKSGNGGKVFLMEGAAASPIQFFITDSSKHFLRGALYYSCPPQPDSLASVTAFLKGDILHLIETLSWK